MPYLKLVSCLNYNHLLASVMPLKSILSKRFRCVSYFLNFVLNNEKSYSVLVVC